MNKISIFVSTLVFFSSSVTADSIPMRDFIQLKNGMTEAEVLYRVGPPDHETAAYDYHHHVLQKTWFYIPDKKEVSNREWITEIWFGAGGKIFNIIRYKP